MSVVSDEANFVIRNLWPLPREEQQKLDLTSHVGDVSFIIPATQNGIFQSAALNLGSFSILLFQLWWALTLRTMLCEHFEQSCSFLFHLTKAPP